MSVQNFQRFVSTGSAKINISTALKHSYLQAAEKTVQQAAGNPLTFDRNLFEAVKETVLSHIKIFVGKEVE